MRAEDPVALDRHFFVGAYWGPRAADPTTCGRQVLRLLSALTALEPSLAAWRREDGTVKSAALPDDPEQLGAQLLAETRDKEVGDGLTGYFVADGIAVSVTLGMTGQYLGNNMVLKPGRQPKPFWLSRARELVTTLVDIFDPRLGNSRPVGSAQGPKRPARPELGGGHLSDRRLGYCGPPYRAAFKLRFRSPHRSDRGRYALADY